MKQLSTYINEKLVLNKDTFKKSDYKYFPKTGEELKKIIKQLLNERNEQNVIDLNDIDTSEITDMSFLFGDIKYIKNINISKWDVSKVTDMYGMFDHCGNLESTGDLSSWDVSNVESMPYMFYNCKKLKYIGDISSWKTSKVESMRCMFAYCDNLESTGDLSLWDVIKVIDMDYMFYNCEKLKDIGDISSWNISNTNTNGITGMFTNSGITNIPDWYKE